MTSPRDMRAAPGADGLSPDDFASRYDGLIFNPLIRRYYGQACAFYNTGYWDDETVTQADASRNLVERLLRTSPSTTPHAVLDVACGLGATTRMLHDRWPSAAVTGINLSPKQVALSRAHAPACIFQTMDAVALDFADASFDLLVCVEAAFHFRTREDFLEEAMRVLRPGGQLILSDILFAGTPWAGAWTVPDENRLDGVDAYFSLLRHVGFEVDLIEDSTDRCWSRYCLSLARWLDVEHAAGRLDDASHQRWSKIVRSITHGAVRHYLLVSVRRPS